jgi:hypothetical protein
MKISTYNVSKLGHSHIQENKVCQDYSLNYSDPDNSQFIAIVSDGHGSKTYCRSDRGSQFACEIAMEAIKAMKLNDLVKGKSAQVPARKPSSRPNGDLSIPKFKDVFPTIKDIDERFEHLFQYIYSQWLQKVETDWQENKPTKEEMQLLGDNETVKAYGATLMAFVRTPDYWFGFHIGDGKLLACDEQGRWFEPILWDADCFLNVTTSLCQTEAYKSFRYSFSGKGDFPIAVMLGTDGIDDSWGDKLPAYYTSILEDISNEGIEKAQESLKKSLPDLSKNGSKDDVSVAWIVDEDAIAGILPKLKMTDMKQENEILSEVLKRKNEEQNIDKEKYKSDINFLTKSIEAAKKEINFYQTKIQQLEQKNRELENDNRQFKAEIDKPLSYKEKIPKLFRKSLQDNVDVNNLDNSILSLQNEVSKFSKLLKDVETIIKTLEQQVNNKENSSENKTVTDTIEIIDNTKTENTATQQETKINDSIQ